MSTILAIPDLHYPFNHQDSIDFLSALHEEHGVDQVVCLGDLFDLHAFSRYTYDPDGFGPGHEFQTALDKVRELYALFPKVKATFGNHDIRGMKKAFESGIPKNFLRSFEEIIECPPGWEWADEHIIDGVLYMHGNGFSGIYATRRMMMLKMMSIVHGHTHGHAGVIHMAQSATRFVTGMNAGCLIDEKAYAMAYAKETPVKASLGAGIVQDGHIMHWHPMIRDTKNRWVGKL